MTQPVPLKVVIIGGGTSGYMTAAGLVALVGSAVASVRLIESDDIGTVGVGEATLPQIKEFNDALGINEAEFMRETKASFKLAIEFRDWGRIGNSYLHPFGAFGQPVRGVEFQHLWARARKMGMTTPLEAYSYAIVTARQLRFDFPSDNRQSLKSTFSYAYHFDAGLYAAYLRRFGEARGLVRTEGKVTSAAQAPDSGRITSVTLESGEVVEGDLFIDCSGFIGLLIGREMKAEWESWTPWLPCDRALAVPCERAGDFTPYTRSTALEAGWQWRIPLQHRTGNGYVYASSFISDDEAAARLLGNLDGAALADPRPLRFSAGRRKKSWTRNCIGIGLASGFLEPLESTSIYLVQIAVMNLIALFPTRAWNPGLATEFNRLMDIEYERVRDFLILHYHANSRDEPLWTHMREMTVPDSLTARIEQFRHRGHLVRYRDGLFNPASWLAVLTGQDIVPEGYDRLADSLDEDTIRTKLEEISERIAVNVDIMPTHADFIRDYCYIPPVRESEGVPA
ncbi:tryptophan halogenase PrnA [Asticcacaulis biprosthecium C19]|uniref:Tryptophan halogenase PrnA n=1 Tax=Asticcacaulis biprosthecium C19 TaxID=715226 RepID=F4QN16_9CAUL|nr:tryptophan halogenase family protein [Asticcacaulis biprosthecium]EGF91607.1 tryptophan halogenase PrnA [Asticcacaulis biprosthecium C19]